MFYLRFLSAELRRRPGRTALTALGLAIGVALVVIVSALSAGLDDAQGEVLEPLTGVGTDMRVSRPLKLPGTHSGAGGDFRSLSKREQRLLKRENEVLRLEPGEAMTKDHYVSTQLSFPMGAVGRVARLDGAKAAAGGLSLQAITVESEGGTNISSLDVTGVDVREPGLAAVTPGQVRRGRYFADSPREARNQAIVDIGYARRNAITVGEKTELAGRRFEVVGLSSAPLGGAASNAYVELRRLQGMSDREGRANVMYVRADSTASVDTLSREIREELPGADVVTASRLADSVGGSLGDAKNLSSKLGTALAAVALGAAFLIATLLTLASVQKRTRELGTLKALGWRKRLVVRQVSAESIVQGLVGGLVGAALGVAGTGVIDALDLKLEASVSPARSNGFGPFGQGQVSGGSAEVVLGAPVEVGLLALAVALAVLGGLIAGGAGGLRAARLRPAEALRSME